MRYVLSTLVTSIAVVGILDVISIRGRLLRCGAVGVAQVGPLEFGRGFARI